MSAENWMQVALVAVSVLLVVPPLVAMGKWMWRELRKAIFDE
jgi:hypothetical protein